MKKFLATLGLSALFLGAMAQDNAKPVGGSGPMISVDKEVHDYGVIDQGANGTCEFKVTNTGDQPLIISNCKGSCGCTVPKCDTAPVAPGKSTIVTVKYDSNRVGPINKTVTISSNATNAPEKIVRIKGEVKGSTSATPTSPVKEVSPMAPTEKSGG
ncbi:MAG: DUF1573 domain-containing protein [Bacteroidetes bacterium]|nr:DUF1573 domain-containing protein [Bacteroidota bacterium]